MSDGVHISYYELAQKFHDHNVSNKISCKGTDKHPIYGVIVFDRCNYEKSDISLENRSWRISSDNKAYIPDQLGYSVFGENLKNKDWCRFNSLADAIKDQHGDQHGDLIVEYCYLEEAPQ